MANDNDPIEHQIDSIGDRQLVTCAVWFAALFAGAVVALAVTFKRSHDSGVRLAVVLGMSGLIFGFAASALAPQARKLLARVFVLLPLVVSLALFANRTLLGRAEELPLRLVLAPLALTAGFLVGRGRPRR
jgi:uncharacterized membrane protein YhaH (DUF805 family)